MNWLDWTPKASNIEKGCPQALPKRQNLPRNLLLAVLAVRGWRLSL